MLKKKFKEYDKVKTLVEKDENPPTTIGIIVSFYPNFDYCEVELWDTDGNSVDVITYETKKLKLF